MSLIIATALALAAAWLAWEVFPLGSAIRVRNALLLRRGRQEDFVWTPASPPAGYRVETQPPPEVIERALREARVLAIDDDWDRALALVTMLVSHRQRQGAIRADLATTWRGIIDGRGYCADYVRVYLAAARGARLFCRQWAFSFDGFGGHGHTFVEVFDPRRGKWSCLDVHNNVYAVLAGSKAPLSALELRRALIECASNVQFPRAGPGPLGFPYHDKLLEYYRRGVAEWYLWWGNDVITREATHLPQPIARWLGGLLHRACGATWRLPLLVALTTAENDAQLVAMERLRRRFVAAMVVAAALAALLLATRVSSQLALVGHG
jgi:hypothetical protein